jgi:tetratricopeptide (TPR) repeat protein
LRGKALARRGEHERAVADAGRAVELDPKAWAPLLLRGESYFKLRQFDKAAADYARAVRQGAETNFRPIERVLLWAASGDRAGYARACTALLERTSEAHEAVAWNNAAWVCTYLPDALPDLAPAVALAEKAVAVQRNHNHLNTLAAVLYRAGKLDEAVRRFEEGMKLHDKGGTVLDWLFLAMAHHRLGHASDAQQWLDKALAWMRQVEEGKVKDAEAERNWRARLELQLLTREAETLLKQPSAGKK